MIYHIDFTEDEAKELQKLIDALRADINLRKKSDLTLEQSVAVLEDNIEQMMVIIEFAFKMRIEDMKNND